MDIKSIEKTKNNEIFIDDEDCCDFDLEDFLIFDLCQTVSKIMDISGVEICSPSVDFGGGTTITIDSQDPYQVWNNRLFELFIASDKIVKRNSSLKETDVFKKIAIADGWSFTVDSIRTPLWMSDIEEIKYTDIENHIEYTPCLEKFLLEIK